MDGTKMTYITCFDEHRSFSEDIRKRFSDATRYSVMSCTSTSDLVKYFQKEAENRSCKIVILGVSDIKSQTAVFEELIAEIKQIDITAGVILLIPPEQVEETKKSIRFNIDAYIPRSVNSVLRIHNAVKKLFSEHNIMIYRHRRNLALYFLLAFILIAVAALVFSVIKYPGYF
jgi:DNA-binding NarL/FixJ family response regulator